MAQTTSRAGSREIKAYVASPEGFTESGRLYLSTVIYPGLKALNISILDPWKWQSGTSLVRRWTDKEINRKGLAVTEQQVLKIGWQKIDYVESADMVVAMLDGQEVDSQVAAQIGHAYALKKRIFGLRTDFRLIGDSALGMGTLLCTYIRGSGGNLYTASEEMFREVERYAALLRKG